MALSGKPASLSRPAWLSGPKASTQRFQAAFTASQLIITWSTRRLLRRVSAPARLPLSMAASMPHSMRSGATAAVGSKRCQRPSSQTSTQAWASAWRTSQ